MVPEFSESFGILPAKAQATFSCLLLFRFAVSKFSEIPTAFHYSGLLSAKNKNKGVRLPNIFVLIV